MPSKEQVNSNDKAASKQPSAKPATEITDILAQQQSHPAAIIQRATLDPGSLTSRDVLQLQRTVGNRVVGQLLARIRSRPAVQAKLMVGAAGDRYEQEADRIADQVMSMPRPAGVQHPGVNESPGAQRQEDEELQAKPLAAAITPLAQRQADEEEEEVQAKHSLQPLTSNLQASFEAGSEIESRLAARRGGGDALPTGVRAYMEPRFSADFSGVRIHTGGEADQLNRQLSAQAFTYGQDIYMRAGKYAPGTSGGNRLLAHELSHVVQQSNGRVIGSGDGMIDAEAGKNGYAIQRMGVYMTIDVKRGMESMAVEGRKVAMDALIMSDTLLGNCKDKTLTMFGHASKNDYFGGYKPDFLAYMLNQAGIQNSKIERIDLIGCAASVKGAIPAEEGTGMRSFAERFKAEIDGYGKPYDVYAMPLLDTLQEENRRGLLDSRLFKYLFVGRYIFIAGVQKAIGAAEEWVARERESVKEQISKWPKPKQENPEELKNIERDLIERVFSHLLSQSDILQISGGRWQDLPHELVSAVGKPSNVIQGGASEASVGVSKEPAEHSS